LEPLISISASALDVVLTDSTPWPLLSSATPLGETAALGKVIVPVCVVGLVVLGTAPLIG